MFNIGANSVYDSKSPDHRYLTPSDRYLSDSSTAAAASPRVTRRPEVHSYRSSARASGYADAIDPRGNPNIAAYSVLGSSINTDAGFSPARVPVPRSQSDLSSPASPLHRSSLLGSATTERSSIRNISEGTSAAMSPPRIHIPVLPASAEDDFWTDKPDVYGDTSIDDEYAPKHTPSAHTEAAASPRYATRSHNTTEEIWKDSSDLDSLSYDERSVEISHNRDAIYAIKKLREQCDYEMTNFSNVYAACDIQQNIPVSSHPCLKELALSLIDDLIEETIGIRSPDSKPSKKEILTLLRRSIIDLLEADTIIRLGKIVLKAQDCKVNELKKRELIAEIEALRSCLSTTSGLQIGKKQFESLISSLKSAVACSYDGINWAKYNQSSVGLSLDSSFDQYCNSSILYDKATYDSECSKLTLETKERLGTLIWILISQHSIPDSESNEAIKRLLADAPLIKAEVFEEVSNSVQPEPSGPRYSNLLLPVCSKLGTLNSSSIEPLSARIRTARCSDLVTPRSELGASRQPSSINKHKFYAHYIKYLIIHSSVPEPANVYLCHQGPSIAQQAKDPLQHLLQMLSKAGDQSRLGYSAFTEKCRLSQLGAVYQNLRLCAGLASWPHLQTKLYKYLIDLYQSELDLQDQDRLQIQAFKDSEGLSIALPKSHSARYRLTELFNAAKTAIEAISAVDCTLVADIGQESHLLSGDYAKDDNSPSPEPNYWKEKDMLFDGIKARIILSQRNQLETIEKFDIGLNDEELGTIGKFLEKEPDYISTSYDMTAKHDTAQPKEQQINKRFHISEWLDTCTIDNLQHSNSYATQSYNDMEEARLIKERYHAELQSIETNSKAQIDAMRALHEAEIKLARQETNNEIMLHKIEAMRALHEAEIKLARQETNNEIMLHKLEAMRQIYRLETSVLQAQAKLSKHRLSSSLVSEPDLASDLDQYDPLQRNCLNVPDSPSHNGQYNDQSSIEHMPARGQNKILFSNLVINNRLGLPVTCMSPQYYNYQSCEAPYNLSWWIDYGNQGYLFNWNYFDVFFNVYRDYDEYYIDDADSTWAVWVD